MASSKLRFGAFIAPFHAMEENPTLAIERDLELVQWMDRSTTTRPGSASITPPASR
jgi:hypothetical protein